YAVMESLDRQWLPIQYAFRRAIVQDIARWWGTGIVATIDAQAAVDDGQFELCQIVPASGGNAVKCGGLFAWVRFIRIVAKHVIIIVFSRFVGDRKELTVEGDTVHAFAVATCANNARNVAAMTCWRIGVYALAVGIGGIRVEVKAARNGTRKLRVFGFNSRVQIADRHALARKAQRIRLGGVDHVQARLAFVFFSTPLLQ